jgi:hypothetical protein
VEKLGPPKASADSAQGSNAEPTTTDPAQPAKKPGFFSRLWRAPESTDVPAADAEPPKSAKGTKVTVQNHTAEKSAKDQRLSEPTNRPSSGSTPAKAASNSSTPAKTAGDAPKGNPAKLAAVSEDVDPAAKKPSLLSRFFGKVVSSADPPAPVKPKSVSVARVESPPFAATSSSLPGPDQWVVTKDESPFYLFGPNQATPPDAYLPTGTVVTVLNKTWGWAEIKLADGRSGTMARGALRLATIYDIAPPSPGRSLFAHTTTPNVSTPSNYVLPSAPIPELPTLQTEPKPTAEELSSSLLPPLEQ